MTERSLPKTGASSSFMRSLKDSEAWGAYTGIPGAMILAMNNGHAHYGWLLFLASNVSWIVFASRGRYTKLLAQQLAFLGTTMVGLYNTVPASWLNK